MAKKQVIQPGLWWIVRFRRRKSYALVTGYMACGNAYHAGHSGFKRKYRFRNSSKPPYRKVKRFVTRKWDLRAGRERRLAYRFASLKDLHGSIRSKVVKEWMEKWDGILEVVEVQGCLYYGTVTSEKTVERRFNTDNEMEILALEHALGED